jgi:hypothetical protein
LINCLLPGRRIGRIIWGYFLYPQINVPPIIAPFPLAVHAIYRTAIDKENPATYWRMRVFELLRISSDSTVVPEAGLEPAQGCPRRILSPILEFEPYPYRVISM